MRILHSMLRVADLEAALEFYTRALDMRLLRRRDYPEGRFTLAFVGYQDERAAAALELTHNWDRDGYTQGDGYGHLAIEVEDAAVTCARADAARTQRDRLPRRPGRLQGGTDPEGYPVRLSPRPGGDIAAAVVPAQSLASNAAWKATIPRAMRPLKDCAWKYSAGTPGNARPLSTRKPKRE